MTTPSVKLNQQAYQHIRSRIELGAIGTDRPISELQLTRELGFSRTPIREAIRQLECEGFLEQRAGSGTYLRKLGLRDIVEIYEARLLFEPFASSRAARSKTPELLRELDQHQNEMLRLIRNYRSERNELVHQAIVVSYGLHDAKLHMALVQTTGNRKLLKMLSDMQILQWGITFPRGKAEEYLAQLETSNREHTAICKAVRQGNAKTAGQAMATHLKNSHRRSLDHLRWLSGNAPDRKAEGNGERAKAASRLVRIQ